MKCKTDKEVSWGLALLTGMAYKAGGSENSAACVCPHTYTRTKKIGWHSDCHQGDELCQVLSSAWREEKGRGRIWPKHRKSYTVKQPHSSQHTHSKVEMPYWQKHRQVCMAFYLHTHTQWKEPTVGYTSQGHTKVPENSLTASLFLLPLKLTSSEYVLVDLIQGCQGDWLGIAKFFLSFHLGINQTGKKS